MSFLGRTIALGLPEVRVIREEETATEIMVEVMYRNRGAPCPRCGQRTPKVHSTKAQPKGDRRVGEALVRRCLTEEAKRLLEAPEKPPLPVSWVWMSSLSGRARSSFC